MAEPPDFDQIARWVLDNLPDTFLTRGSSGDEAIPGVAEQLRQVWNARGAADLDALDTEIGRTMSSETDVRPYLEQLASALRTLDR